MRALWLWIGVAAALGIGAFLALGNRDRGTYPQDTPEAVLQSALAMFKNGDADQLPRLIYADSREYRSVLNRFGTLLGSLQSLAGEIKTRFPESVEQLRAQVQEASATKTTEEQQAAVLAAVNDPNAPAMPTNVPRDRAERIRMAQRFEDLSQRILADPFIFIEVNAPRLSVEQLDDDTATVKFDDQPLLAGILQIKRHEGLWYLVLPLNLPMVSNFTPQTRNEWSIIGSLLKMADNVVKELTDELRSGQIGRIEQLANKMGEKAFLPGAMIFVVYGKEMDVRRQRERAVRSFRARAKEWGQAREAAGDDPSAVKTTVDALGKVAVERMDELVRKRSADRAVQLPKWEGMAEDEFLRLTAEWLKGVGDEAALAGLTGGVSPERASRLASLVERNLKGTIKPVTDYK